jgi:hypothetical protein
MKRKSSAGLLSAVLAVILVTGFGGSAEAVITSGPISLQHGFPLWMQDEVSNRVQICLDAACIPDPPIAGDAFSQQIGFGAEAFWWIVDTVLPGTLPGVGLVEFAMEAAWNNEVPARGDWFPFTRIRIRFDANATGTYTISHPFGVETVVVDAVGPGLEINISRDIPVGAPPDFVQIDAPGQIPRQFFTVAGVLQVPGQVFSGTGTIAITPPAQRNTVIVAGPAAGGLNFTATDFTVAGRYFENALTPVANQPPVAVDDTAGVVFGSTAGVTINVTANDTDAISPANAHTINPRATAIGTPTPGAVIPLVNAPLGPLELVPNIGVASARGGNVRKNPDGTFTYTPTGTLVGEDTFTYTVQDTGGRFDSGLVTIRVEQLTVSRASLRVKQMKWDIAGRTTVFPTLATPHLINLHLGPDGTGPRIGTATVQTDGSWRFSGISNLNPGALRAITCVSSVGAVLPSIPLVLK